MVQASHHELSVLVGLRAALRRLATLVARGVSSSEVFSAVAEELARCLGVRHWTLVHFERNGAACDGSGSRRMPVGERFFARGRREDPALVYHTRRAARIDSHDNGSGSAPGRDR
jgi:uncharacterized protein YoaH (UPF0181 family)